MNLNIKGRVAIVTGATKGIGLAIVKGLISEGVSVLLIARDKNILDSVVIQLKEIGGDVYGLHGDVANSKLPDDALKIGRSDSKRNQNRQARQRSAAAVASASCSRQSTCLHQATGLKVEPAA